MARMCWCSRSRQTFASASRSSSAGTCRTGTPCCGGSPRRASSTSPPAVGREGAMDPTPEVPPGPFRVTVLRARGKRLVKTYSPAGKRSTEKAASFLVERHEVSGFRGFADFLFARERRPDACVIRGAPGGPWFPGLGKPVYRLLHPQAAYVDTRGRKVTPAEVAERRRQAEIGETLFDATWLPMFVEEPTCW